MVILNDPDHLTYFAMIDTGVPGPLLGISLPASGITIVDLVDHLEEADGDWFLAIHQAWVHTPQELTYHLPGEVRLAFDDQCISVRHDGRGVQSFVNTLGELGESANTTFGPWRQS